MTEKQVMFDVFDGYVLRSMVPLPENHAKYTIQILPEAASEIGDFNLLAECRWLRGIGNSYEIGFMVIESPKGKQFERYVDYLAWQAS
jgi:hypothetical protein